MIYVATCWLVVSSLEAAHKNLFQESLWDHQVELEFPHANMKQFNFGRWENAMIPLSHNGKIRIKH